MDKADQRVAAHRAAQQRRAQGLRSWAYNVDLSPVWLDEELTFEQRRDKVAAILRNSTWFKAVDGSDDSLRMAVEELEEAGEEEMFDMVFDRIYDLADADRAWIRTSF